MTGRIAVFHLLRKANDTRYSWAFFDSILRHPAGADYTFVLLLKGFEATESAPCFELVRHRLPADAVILRYPDSLSATEVLIDAAGRIDCDRFLFFTSWARILAPGWLRRYLDAFDRTPDAGIVGATGSYERLNDTTPFPNWNIRTNGFMVRRDLFTAIEPGDLTSELGGHLFEAGPGSMTKQIAAMGYRALVVDRYGGLWPHDAWHHSRTFRAGEQENLLVADNRTMHFRTGSIRKRRRLARRAWGTDEGVKGRLWLLRQFDRYAWDCPRGLSDLWSDIVAAVRRRLPGAASRRD